MPSFTYTARDAAGRPRTGDFAANDIGELTSILRGRGWIVLDVRTAADPSAPGAQRRWNPFDWLPPTKLDVEIGFEQIASMLRSGLTLLAAIKTAGEQARRPTMSVIWQQIYDRIQEGSSFANALARHPRVFPEFCIQLVKVGEQSGTLEVVLSRAAEHLERRRSLRATLLNAFLYPTIVIVMAIGVAAFMLISVIPKLQKFLAGRGRKLPPITQALLDVSAWAQTYYPHMLILLCASIVAFIFVLRWPPGQLWIHRRFLRIPIMGKLLRTAATAVFARGLGLLLESGITLLEALKTAENLMGNRALGAHLAEVRDSVIQGGTLANPLVGARWAFMPMLGRMVAVGEATGTMSAILNEVAEFHEKQLAASVRRLSILVEPAIIIVVGGIVGFVYIAFFVALFSLAG